MDVFIIFLLVACLGYIIAQRVLMSKVIKKNEYLTSEKEHLELEATKFKNMYESIHKENLTIKKINSMLQSENGKIKNSHKKKK